MRSLSPIKAEEKVRVLADRYADTDSDDVLHAVITREFAGRIVLASSFGAESAVLLDMVARIDPATPVIFLDTGRLFPETHQYRDALVARLKLTGVISVTPQWSDLSRHDAEGGLARCNPDLCCHIRKVAPMNRALDSFDAWITGRKGYQGGERTGLPLFEASGRHVKVNPIAGWDRNRVESYFATRDLPPHPLVSEGYASIGCQPCTVKNSCTADPRAGRWQGHEKTECGIHRPAPNGSHEHRPPPAP